MRGTFGANDCSAKIQCPKCGAGSCGRVVAGPSKEPTITPAPESIKGATMRDSSLVFTCARPVCGYRFARPVSIAMQRVVDGLKADRTRLVL